MAANDVNARALWWAGPLTVVVGSGVDVSRRLAAWLPTVFILTNPALVGRRV